MSEIGRRLLETCLGSVHAWHRPGSGLPLVLLHMSPRSGRMYHEAMALLDRPTLAIDRPGFGFSDRPVSPPSMSDYAAATLDVVDAFDWEAFDVIGTHTGSVEAVELAYVAPERVRKIGVVAIPAYTRAEVEERLAGVAAPRMAPVGDGSHLMRMWEKRSAIRPKDTDPGYLHELFVDELLSAPGAHEAYRAVLAYPMADRIGELGDEVVVFAPGDDLRRQTTRALAEINSDPTVVDLPHLDFDLWTTAPDEMVKLIERHFPWNAVPKPVRLANNKRRMR